MFFTITQVGTLHAKTVSLTSPNAQTEFILETGSQLNYSVQFNSKTIIEHGVLGIKIFKSPALGPNMEIVSSEVKTVDESWKPVVKQHENIQNHYNEMVIQLKELKFPGRKLGIIVRAYNDGIAFRYDIPKGAGAIKSKLEKELTTFKFANDYTCWAANYGSYYSHQEAEFTKQTMSELLMDGVYGMPLTIKVDENCYAAITEANLDKWAGMYLKRTNMDGILSADLAEAPAGNVPEKFKFEMTLPHQSPWRVIMLGNQPGKLIESEIVMNLNPPCEIDNTDWIKPGLCAWDSWWSKGVVMENNEIKKYIDLAAENNFPYMLIDWQWYGDYNKPTADVTTVAEQLDMPMLLEYAKSKNVKLWLWLYWSDVTRNMEKAFELYEKWGIAGVKIDFMARDDYEMVDWYHNTVKLAAEHHLMINFHGAYKPTGLRRTYPNFMTREGVMGNEHNKWSYQVTPEHNVTLPFTRMLAGHMDYTPGGFNNVAMGQFKIQINTLVMGTRCHELAKFVVYDSPITTVCDHPDNYKGQVGMDFLQQVKAQWDDTQVLSGAIGEYIVTARRAGKEWFVGGMSNSEARTLELNLSFLPEGKFKIKIYKDAKGADKDATLVEIKEMQVNHTQSLKIECAPGGGFVAIITQ